MKKFPTLRSIAFLALGMGGAVVTAGQALLGRWVNEAASRRGDAV